MNTDTGVAGRFRTTGAGLGLSLLELSAIALRAARGESSGAESKGFVGEAGFSDSVGALVVVDGLLIVGCKV